MTTVSRFSRQNDAGLSALNVVLWKNLVLVVVLVLESKALYWEGNGIKVEKLSLYITKVQERNKTKKQKECYLVSQLCPILI